MSHDKTIGLISVSVGGDLVREEGCLSDMGEFLHYLIKNT